MAMQHQILKLINTKEDTCSSRPATIANNKNVVAVKAAVEEDVCYIVEEINNRCGINSSAVLQIMKETLKLRKVCARWIPHFLTEDQKDYLRIARLLLDKYAKVDPKCMNEIITVDETWFYFYELEGK